MFRFEQQDEVAKARGQRYGGVCLQGEEHAVERGGFVETMQCIKLFVGQVVVNIKNVETSKDFDDMAKVTHSSKYKVCSSKKPHKIGRTPQEKYSTSLSYIEYILDSRKK